MKSLRQVLTECVEPQLEQIARLWAIGDASDKEWTTFAQGAEPRAGIRTRLEHGMRDMISARFVWEHLAEDQRQVLYNVLGTSGRNWVVRDDLPKKVQLPAARYTSALDRLKQLVLVHEVLAKIQGNQLVDHRMGFYAYGIDRRLPVQSVDILYVPMEIATFLYTTGREFFTPQSDRAKQTLEKLLAPAYQSDLDEIGRRYSVELDGSYYTRTDYRSMLAASLVQPEAVYYALQQLDPTTRNLFTLLYERGGTLSLQEIRTYTGFDDAALSSVLHTLAEYAIAFDTFSGQERVLFIPSDTYKNLRQAPPQVEGPGELVPLQGDSPPLYRGGEMITLFDLATVIGVIYQQDIEPTKAGRVPKRIASKIYPLLRGLPRAGLIDEEENDYLEMLIDIAQELGLLQLSRSPEVKERYEPGPFLDQWSRLDAVEQTRRLLQIWSNSGRWGDIVGANYIEWFSGYVEPRAVRGSLLSRIRACEAKQWYTVGSLVALIRGQDPFVLRPRQRGIASIGYRKANELRQHWDTCDREIVIGSLSSSLTELGMVALGYQNPEGTLSGAGGARINTLAPAENATLGGNQGARPIDEPINPDFFMLTDLGAAVLSSETKDKKRRQAQHGEVAMQDGKRAQENGARNAGDQSLVVQPNFELLLLRPDLPTLYNLLPFAQVNQVGVVSRLTLTRESILRGIAAGKRIEQILQSLEERSQKGVPQNVAYTLNDWAKLYKGATMSQVVLLEVSSEAVANEVCASPKLQEFGLRRLGPCAIAASSDVNLQELRRTLDKMGIVARIGTTMSANRASTGGRGQRQEGMLSSVTAGRWQ